MSRRRFLGGSSAQQYQNVPIPNQVTSRTTSIFPFTVGGNDWQGRAFPFKNALGEWGCCWIEGTAHSLGTAANYRLNIAFSDDEGVSWTANNKYIGGGSVTGFPLGVVAGGASYVNEVQVIPCPNGELVLIAMERSSGGAVITHSQYRSTDNGASWAFELDFVDALGISDNTKVQAVYEHMVSGSVVYLTFCEVRTDLDDTRIRLFKSTDNCETYIFVSNPVEYDEANPDCTESSIADLGNGIFFCVLRTQNLGQAVWKRSENFGVTWGALTEFSSVIGYVGVHQPRVIRFANFFLLSGRDSKQILADPASTIHDRTAFWTTTDLFVTARKQYLDPYYAGNGETGTNEGDSGYGRSLVREDGTFVFFGYFGTQFIATIYLYEASNTGSPSTEHYSNTNYFPSTITNSGFRLQLNRDNIFNDPAGASPTLGGLALIHRAHNTLNTGSKYWGASGTGTVRPEFTVINDIGWAIFDGTSTRIQSFSTVGNTLYRSSFSMGVWLLPADGQPAGTGVIIRDSSLLSTATDDRVQLLLTTAGRIQATYHVNAAGATAETANVIFANGAITTPVHVAATFTSGGVIRIYIDGVLQGYNGANTGNIAAITMSGYTTINNTYIGTRQGTDGSTFDLFYAGKMREIICQPVVWSAGDITNIMLN